MIEKNLRCEVTINVVEKATGSEIGSIYNCDGCWVFSPARDVDLEHSSLFEVGHKLIEPQSNTVEEVE